MVACPFCRKPVKEDLLRFGGHCPHCLIEVPGEEAATDPGEAAKAKERAEAETARKRKRRMMVPVALFSTLAMGMVGWLALRPEPELPAFTLEDFEVVPLSAHKDLPASDVGDPGEVADGGGDKRSPKSRDSGQRGNGGSGADGSSNAGSSAPRDPEVVADNRHGSSAPGYSPHPSDGPVIKAGDGANHLTNPFDPPTVGPGNRGVQGIEYCKDEEVRTMIKAVVERYGAQLNQCYNTALNTNERLRGRWKVMFTLEKSGSPGPVKVLAPKGSDAGFEDCLKRNVQKWQFGRICTPIDLNLPFSFGPK